jgi:hypothetical protein
MNANISSQLAVEVEDHKRKDVIQCLRRNAFKRHLTMCLDGHDQSTAANSVASILEFVILRACAIAEDTAVRRTLTKALNQRWAVGQRSTICKVGVYHLSHSIIHDLVDEAVDFSHETQSTLQELRLQDIRDRGLIWNRTSPGWRYFRAMHVYEDLYESQSLPEIESMVELGRNTRDYYGKYIEKRVQLHKLTSASKKIEQKRGLPSKVAINNDVQRNILIDNETEQIDVSESDLNSLGLTQSWKLRQKIQQDCVAPLRLIDRVEVDIDQDQFDLKLSPHLSNALQKSGKQIKDQEVLSAIKRQAKTINEAAIANFSVPSPTLIKWQKQRVSRSIHTFKRSYAFVGLATANRTKSS